MTEIIVKIPAHLKPLAQAMRVMVESVTKFERDAPRGRTVDYRAHERGLADAAAEIERQAHVASLSSLDCDADRIRIDGVVHVRVLEAVVANYNTRVGPVPVARSLFRPEGKRNAKTVNTVTLRSGAIKDEWLPDTASAMAYRLARGTSREAAQAAAVERTLPYSHSSFEKIGHAVGKKMVAPRIEIEEALIAELEIPKEAHSISAALDRTSMPMEEPCARPVGRPRNGAPKKPIAVVYRMAWTGTVTIHDVEGDAIHTIRYGRMPHEDGDSLAMALASDMLALVRRCPRLKVVTLGDGAEQIQKLLAEHVDEETFGCEIRRLIDLWHVIEKLAAALKVIESDENTRKARLAECRRRLCTRRDAPTTILAELRASGRENLDDKECSVHAAITYFENQGHLMAYVDARRDGLPVGSGNVEATCKSLFGLRMKRPGARWKTETGADVITMRAHLLSDRWNRASEIALPPRRVEIRAA